MSTSPSLPSASSWSSTVAGNKASSNPDVALADCDGGRQLRRGSVHPQPGRSCAHLQSVAAIWLTTTGGRVTAALVNAGNANSRHRRARHRGLAGSPCIAAANQFGCVFDEIFPSSTGIIGVPLPVEKLIAAVPAAAAALGNTPEHAEAFATAILTTDNSSSSKSRVSPSSSGDKTVNLWGCCVKETFALA